MVHEGKRSGSGKELPALVLVAAWVACIEVAPFAHLAMHAALPAHDHGALERDAHCHGTECHPEHPDDRGSDGADAPVDEHGAHSLLHRTIAMSAPATPVPPVPPPALTSLAREQPVVSAPTSARRDPPRARGPPTARA